MARSERQEDGTRAGVGTMSRPGRRPPPGQVPEAAPPAPDPRRGRPPRPAPPASPAGRGAVTPARSDPGPRGQRVTLQAPAVALPPAPRGGQRPRRSGAPQAAAAPARPGQRPGAAPWRVPPAERTTGPQQAPRNTGPQSALRTTGPQPALRTSGPQTALLQEQAAPPQPRRQSAAAAGSHRMPFVLLLCGLLGGALISALVISTTLAEGSFKISKLQDSITTLTQQRQVLQQEVAQAQSPQVIAQRASKLGLRRVAELRFLDLTTGKTSSDGPTWSGAANAPGYAP